MKGIRSVIIVASMVCGFLNQCTVVPKAEDKPVTQLLPAPKTGTLVKTSTRLASIRSKGESSFLLIENNKEALEWRLALIDEAKSSIDIQLYLWQKGSSSRLLFDRLLRAADRGVRVRVLVDDFLFSTNEKTTAAICRYHPNMDIRIFNPTKLRGNPLGSAAEFLLNFQHLNRRMHNKTWTVDQTFTIVGGRNVGDHYYGLDEDYNFIDLDVLVTGPVVKEVGAGFNLFWNSTQSYPGKLLSSRGQPKHLAKVREQLEEDILEEQSNRLALFPITPRSWAKEFGSLPDRMVRGRARFLQDHPDPKYDKRSVMAGLQDITSGTDGEVVLVSPYLIPSDGAISRLAEDIQSGMKIGILAPSLAANNQAAAHGHYRHKREALVKSGAQLYEMRYDPGPDLRSWVDVNPVRSKEIALHMKLIVGDRERCFIGSLNLDPRGMVINTESGLLIDSPKISNQLLEILKGIVDSDDTWKVSLNDKDKLIWNSRGETRSSEPPARFTKKMLSYFVGWLPIESQL